MIRLTNHAQNFACKMCGKCCRNSWKIALDDEKAAQYEKLAENDEFFAEHYKFDVDTAGRAFIHDCKLLLPDMRCYLHSEYGAEALSSVCLSYPRLFLRTNLLLEVGMSYACPEAAKLLGTGITVCNIADETYDKPLPPHPKRIFLDSRYYRFEGEVLSALMNDDFSPQIFSRLQKCLSSGKVCYPSFEKSGGGFSRVQLDFVKYAVGKAIDLPDLEELAAVETSVDSLIDENGDVFKDYFVNFFFVKSFYPYRELEEDTLLMAQFVFCLIRFIIATKIHDGAKCDRETILGAVGFAEENFLHKNSHAVDTLNYISEWY